MKDNVLKPNKSAICKQKKGPSSVAQVETFIEQYRPALKALANE